MAQIHISGNTVVTDQPTALETQLQQALGNAKTNSSGVFQVAPSTMTKVEKVLVANHITPNKPASDTLQLPNSPQLGLYSGIEVQLSQLGPSLPTQGANAVGNAANQIFSALNFVFSLQFLYVIGGFALLLLALVMIAKKAK